MTHNKTDNTVVKIASHEEVQLFANAARISDRTGPVQVVRFSEVLNNTDMKLIELPMAVLDSLEKGERVVFRGQPDDNLVICTQNICFEVQQADTSNLLLLSPDILVDDDITCLPYTDETLYAQVLGSFHETFELKEFRPRYERVFNLLDKYPFIGVELENENKMKGSETVYSFNDLLKECQCSEEQLSAYLQEIQALEIDGFCRILDVSYRDSILFQILNLIEEKGWDWNAFPHPQCIDILSSLFPKFVLEHVISMFCKSVAGEYVSLNEDLICKFHAECLLRPVQRFSYTEFTEIWQQSVPSGMRTKHCYLTDMSICDMNSSPPSIWFFPEKRLDSQPFERLVQLFREKEKWTEDEIKPFLIPLETNKLSVNSILLRYTRSSTDSKHTKYFSLKKTH